MNHMSRQEKAIKDFMHNCLDIQKEKYVIRWIKNRILLR